MLPPDDWRVVRGPVSIRQRVLMGSVVRRLGALSGGQALGAAGGVEHFPFSRREIAQAKPADADAQEAERGMADGGGHAPDLAVFALSQFKRNPAGGHRFAETNGRMAGRNLRLRFPGARSGAFLLPAASPGPDTSGPCEDIAAASD